jgi:hypothetical protein
MSDEKPMGEETRETVSIDVEALARNIGRRRCPRRSPTP